MNSTVDARQKILFATLHPPGEAFSGGSATVYLLVRLMIEAGFDVAFLYLDPARHPSETHETARRKLGELGVTEVEYVEFERDLTVPRQISGVSGLKQKIYDRLFYSEEYYRPWKMMAGQVKEKVDAIKPDFCFLYMIDICAAFDAVKSVPKILGIGVFPHKLEYVRLGLLHEISFKAWLFQAVQWVFQKPKYMHAARLSLDAMDRVCAFAKAEHLSTLKIAPSTNVRYFANPIPDECPALNVADINPTPKVKPCRVVIVGHLRGSATQSGLRYFANEIIPALRRKGIFDQFSFEVIGKFEPPEWLASKLNYPNVKFLGFVNDFVGKVRKADVYLVPTPDDAGNRGRIVSAWSIGCCVVAHVGSRAGMPEIEHQHNSLLGSTGVAMAEAIALAATDRMLNHRLRVNGRRTYDKSYRPDVSFPPIAGFIVDAGPPHQFIPPSNHAAKIAKK